MTKKANYAILSERGQNAAGGLFGDYSPVRLPRWENTLIESMRGVSENKKLSEARRRYWLRQLGSLLEGKQPARRIASLREAKPARRLTTEQFVQSIRN